MIDFGLVDAVDAEAIGEPGGRTFRLRSRVADQYAALWMEKQELEALGRSFSQLLAERSSQRGRPTDAIPDFGAFPAQGQVDMQVVRMGLDFDVEAEHIILLADDAPTMQRGDSPAFRMEISRAQAISVIALIQDVVSAGRPMCPLCRQPLQSEGQDHFCPRTNGHSPDLDLPEVDSD